MERNMVRWTIAAVATVLVGVGGTTTVGAAAAAPAAPQPVEATNNGWVRFGHFAPAVEPVDLYVDGSPVATDVAYKGVSAYVAVPAGAHEFAVRPQDQPDAAPVLVIDAGVPAGGAVTIGAVVTRDGLAAQVYDDDLTPPAAGQALVRFIHAVPDQQPVDIAVAGGATIAPDVSYPNATEYLPVEAGTYDIDVRTAGTANVLLHIAGWSIAAGEQASVILIDGADGKLDVVPLQDSASVAVMPTGGVQTGFGGMAPPAAAAHSWPQLAAVSTFGAAALGALGTQRRRAASRRHPAGS
jgi:hypothetical protein